MTETLEQRLRTQCANVQLGHDRRVLFCEAADALSALRKYARHEPECTANFDSEKVGVKTRGIYPCTCGLAALLGDMDG